MQSNEKVVQINKTLPKDNNSTIPEEQEDDIESGKRGSENSLIDLLAILQKCLDRAIFLYIFMHEVRLSGVRASIAIVHIRKFYKMK